MKFKLGDLVKYVWVDFKNHSGRIVVPIPTDSNRGNSIGLIIETTYPLFDSRLYYTYKVRYQNGYVSWEVEDNLRLLEIFLNKTKYL